MTPLLRSLARGGWWANFSTFGADGYKHGFFHEYTTLGIFCISHHRHKLYDDMLDGWTRHEFDMPNHSGQGKVKERRVECVWTNY